MMRSRRSKFPLSCYLLDRHEAHSSILVVECFWHAEEEKMIDVSCEENLPRSKPHFPRGEFWPREIQKPTL